FMESNSNRGGIVTLLMGVLPAIAAAMSDSVMLTEWWADNGMRAVALVAGALTTFGFRGVLGKIALLMEATRDQASSTEAVLKKMQVVVNDELDATGKVTIPPSVETPPTS
ncbi:MAG: hypothetical protein ACPGVY_09660, partial [Mycobacterium sp.]